MLGVSKPLPAMVVLSSWNFGMITIRIPESTKLLFVVRTWKILELTSIIDSDPGELPDVSLSSKLVTCTAHTTWCSLDEQWHQLAFETQRLYVRSPSPGVFHCGHLGWTGQNSLQTPIKTFRAWCLPCSNLILQGQIDMLESVFGVLQLQACHVIYDGQTGESWRNSARLHEKIQKFVCFSKGRLEDSSLITEGDVCAQCKWLVLLLVVSNLVYSASSRACLLFIPPPN